MTKKPILFRDPLHKFDWLLYLGWKQEDAIANYMKIHQITDFIEPSRGSVGRFFANSTVRNGGLWFRDKAPTVGVIAHECFHLVSYMFDTIGQKIGSDSEESAAYYLEWITNSVEKCVKRR